MFEIFNKYIVLKTRYKKLEHIDKDKNQSELIEIESGLTELKESYKKAANEMPIDKLGAVMDKLVHDIQKEESTGEIYQEIFDDIYPIYNEKHKNIK